MAEIDITYIVLGQLEDSDMLCGGFLKIYKRSKPDIAALYSDLLRSIIEVKTKYFCILDGGEDRLMPGFTESIKTRIDEMVANNVPIGYSDEYVGNDVVVSGEFSIPLFNTRPTMLHHGIVCCTKTAQNLDWPEPSQSSRYILGVILYGTLAQRGFIYHAVPVYKWNPSVNGARCWPGTSQAIANSLAWVNTKNINVR